MIGPRASSRRRERICGLAQAEDRRAIRQFQFPESADLGGCVKRLLIDSGVGHRGLG
jgi:hypothetical protein